MTSSAGSTCDRQMSLPTNATLGSASKAEESIAGRRNRLHQRRESHVSDLTCFGRLTPLLSVPMPDFVNFRAGPTFSQEQLDAALYGYAATDDPNTPRFALSGVRPANGALSYGWYTRFYAK
jgi:hypothetical protein